jgi:hypothetical protein
MIIMSHNIDRNDGMALDLIATKIFLSVIFNWNTINQDEQIMNVLNIESNGFCIHLKRVYPTMRDEFIQAKALTMLIIMYIMIMRPMNGVFDNCGDSNDHLFNNDGVVRLFDKFE